MSHQKGTNKERSVINANQQELSEIHTARHGRNIKNGAAQAELTEAESRMHYYKKLKEAREVEHRVILI